MAGILLDWVNDHAGLSRPVASFERDFANGFLVGDILRQHNLLSDSVRLVDSATSQTKVDNWGRLEPVLVGLGLKFDARTASRIMAEQRGEASKLIYRLKGVLDGLEQAQNGQKVDYPLSVTTLNRPHRDDGMWFKDQVRKAVDRQAPKGAVSMSLRLARFEEERNKHEEKAHELERQYSAEERQRIQMRRGDLLAQHRERQQQTKEMEQSVKRAHSHNTAARRKREALEYSFKMEKQRREDVKVQTMNETAAVECMAGLAEFERNMRRLGADQEDVPTPSPSQAKFGDPPSRTTTTTTTTTPAAATSPSSEGRPAVYMRCASEERRSMEREMEAYMTRLKVRKHDEASARREREQRRRRLLLEQQRTQQQVEETQREQEMIERLAKQSQEEVLIAKRMEEIRQEKEIVKQNRLFREQQHAERRQREWEEALGRDIEMGRQMRDEYERQAEVERQRHRELTEVRIREKTARHETMCRDIFLGLTDLAMKMVEHTQSTSAPPTSQRVWEWKALFVKGVPLFPEQVEVQNVEEEPHGVLDEADLADYIRGGGTWMRGGGETSNALITQLLGKVMDATRPCPRQGLSTEESTPVHVRICLLGKPFAGKTIQAKALASRFGLRVLAVCDVIENAMRIGMEEGKQCLAAEEDPTEESEDGAQTTIGKLGMRARQLLLTGQAVEAGLVVAMVAETVRSLRDVGLIMDGFPSTITEAKLLEKELSGYVDSGKKKKKKMSAPPQDDAPPVKEGGVKSGIDLVLLLDVMDDIVIRRSTGRWIDPETGCCYHMEFNPPPRDAVMHARLVRLGGDDLESCIMQERVIAAASEIMKITEWQKRFGNCVTIDANRSEEVVIEDVCTVVRGLMEKHQRDTCKLDQETKAADVNTPTTAEVPPPEGDGQPPPTPPPPPPPQEPSSLETDIPVAESDKQPGTREASASVLVSVSAPASDPAPAPAPTPVLDPTPAQDLTPTLDPISEEALTPASPAPVTDPAPAPAPATLVPPLTPTPVPVPVVEDGAPPTPKSSLAAPQGTGRSNSPRTAPQGAEAPLEGNAFEHMDRVDSSLAMILLKRWNETKERFEKNIKPELRTLRDHRSHIEGIFRKATAESESILRKPHSLNETLSMFREKFNDVINKCNAAAPPVPISEEEERKKGAQLVGSGAKTLRFGPDAFGSATTPQSNLLDPVRRERRPSMRVRWSEKGDTSPHNKSFADVMRHLSEMVEEFQENLWDICDRRRDEAEAGCNAVLSSSSGLRGTSTTLADALLRIMQCEIIRHRGTRQFIRNCALGFRGEPLERAAGAEIDLINLKHDIRPKSKASVRATASPLKKELQERKPATVGTVPPRRDAQADKKKERDKKGTRDARETVVSAQPWEIQQQVDEDLDRLQRGRASAQSFMADTNEKKFWVAGVGKVLEEEETLANHRLCNVEEHGLALFADLQWRVEATQTTIEGWVGRRYRAELDLVEGAMVRIREVVEEVAPLPGDLRFPSVRSDAIFATPKSEEGRGATV